MIVAEAESPDKLEQESIAAFGGGFLARISVRMDAFPKLASEAGQDVAENHQRHATGILAGMAVAACVLVMMIATEPKLAIVWDEGHSLSREARVRMWLHAMRGPRKFAATWNPPTLEMCQPLPARQPSTRLIRDQSCSPNGLCIGSGPLLARSRTGTRRFMQSSACWATCSPRRGRIYPERDLGR